MGLFGDCESLRVSSILLGFWFVGNDTHSYLLSMVSLALLLRSLDLSSFSLLLELLFSDLFLLHLVDGLDQNVLVLEQVTLGGKIEMMVNILGDLLGFSILSKKSSKYSLSSHPEDLAWHSCVGGTLSLTITGVSSYSLKKLTSCVSKSKIINLIKLILGLKSQAKDQG